MRSRGPSEDRSLVPRRRSRRSTDNVFDDPSLFDRRAAEPQRSQRGSLRERASLRAPRLRGSAFRSPLVTELFRNAVVLGTGLMGTSMALALTERKIVG